MMMIRNRPPSRLLAILLVALLGMSHVTTAINFGFNKEKREQRRKLTQEQQRSGSSAYDDWADAATGTVRAMKSPEEKAAEVAAQTCDGQMALSVVKAVEEKDHAIEERDIALQKMEDAFQKVESLEKELASTKATLQAELASTGTTLRGTISELEERLQAQRKLAAERVTEITEAAEQTVAKAKSKSEEKMAQVHASMASLAAEKNLEISNLRIAAEKRVADANAKAGEIVAQVHVAMEKLTAEKATEVRKIQNEAETRIAEAHDKTQEAVAQVNAAMENLVVEKDNEVKSMQQEMADHKAALYSDMVGKISAIEQERDDKVSDVVSRMEAQERAAKEQLETTRMELVSKMDAEVGRLLEEMKQMKHTHGEEVQTMTEKLRTFEETKRKWQQEKETIERNIAKAAEELEHWESVFSQRSYCNLTHIGEDAAFAAWVASIQATEKLASAATQAAETAKKVSEKTLKTAEPHIQLVRQKSQKFYGDYVEKHVESLRPHYRNYAAPVVEKATLLGSEYHTKYAAPAIVTADQKVRQVVIKGIDKIWEWFDSLVAHFARDCRTTMSSVQHFAKEKDITLPKFLVNQWTETCQHPRESVTICFKALGLLLVFLFRRRIYRTIRWCIILPFSLLWYFTPFRLLFTKKNQTTAITDSQPGKTNSGTPSNGNVHTSENSSTIRVKKKAFRVSQ